MDNDKFKPVPLKTKEKIKKFFMEGKTYEEMEAVTGVPVKLIAKFVKDGKWRKTKRELARNRYEDAEIAYRDWQAKEKENEAKRQHKVASMIEEKVSESIENLDPNDKGADVKLARAARTLNDAAAVGARAVGMAERKEEVNLADERGKGGGKIPIIVIGAQGLKPKKPGEVPAEVLDIEFEEHDQEEEDDGQSG